MIINAHLLPFNLTYRTYLYKQFTFNSDQETWPHMQGIAFIYQLSICNVFKDCVKHTTTPFIDYVHVFMYW